MEHHASSHASNEQSFADVAFVAVPAALLCGGVLLHSIISDSKLGRQHREAAARSDAGGGGDRASSASARLPQSVDQSLRESLRVTFLLGGVINVLSLSITGPQFFRSGDFTAASYLRADTTVLKNMLHGCFLLGGFVNWTQTGNTRYATLVLVILLCMACTSAVAVVISVYQAWRFGLSAVALQTASSLLLGALCVLCGLLVRTARDFSLRSASTLFPALSPAPRALAAAAQAAIDARLGARRAAEYHDVRVLTRALIVGEGALFALANAVFLVQRLGTAADQGPVPFSQFVFGFVGAYTMAIHVGWLLGNGLHAVDANSLESFNLWMWAKAVFGTLAWAETLAMVAFSPWGSGDGQPSSTQLRFCLLFSAVLGSLQLWSLVCVRRLQRLLREVGFTDDAQFVPAGRSVAAAFGFSVLALAKLERLSPQLRSRAFRAGAWALASACLFQAQCVLLAWLDPTTRSIFPAFNFGLHFSAIFMLTFYRSVQDYEQRLRKRTVSLQASVFGVYALGSAAQAVAACLVARERGGWWVSSNDDGNGSSNGGSLLFVALFAGARWAVNSVAAYYFVRLRILPDDDPMPQDPPELAELAAAESKANNADDAESGLELHSLSSSPAAASDAEATPLFSAGGERKRSSWGAAAAAAAAASSTASDPDAGGGSSSAETASLLGSASSASAAAAGQDESLVPAASSTDASAGVAQLDARDRAAYALAHWSIRGYLAAFAALCLAVVVADAAAGADPRGFFGRALTVADISAHSSAYHIAFHFCFLLLGYTKRGHDAANVMFLQFACFAGASIVLTVSAAFASRAWQQLTLGSGGGGDDGDGGPFPPLGAVWSLLLWAVNLATAFNVLVLQRVARLVQRNAHLFPQNTHAMV